MEAIEAPGAAATIMPHPLVPAQAVLVLREGAAVAGSMAAGGAASMEEVAVTTAAEAGPMAEAGGSKWRGSDYRWSAVFVVAVQRLSRALRNSSFSHRHDRWIKHPIEHSFDGRPTWTSHPRDTQA